MPFFKSPVDVNYCAFGPAWQDRVNKVSELSAQVGKAENKLSDAQQRAEHQTGLLNARLQTVIDTFNTPVVIEKKKIGFLNAPYMKVSLPNLADVGVLPTRLDSGTYGRKSMNEGMALSKLKADFRNCDESVRSAFLTRFDAMSENVKTVDFTSKLKKLRHELGEFNKPSELNEPPRKITDLSAQRQRKQLLEAYKTEVSNKRGMKKLAGQAQVFMRTNRQLRSVDRKITALENPSSYEKHIAAGNGEKVSGNKLYIEELKNRRRHAAGLPVEGWTNPAQPPSLETEKNARDFTEKAFLKLSSAIREFQRDPSPEQEQALRASVLPILRHEERVAVHRFIREMTRQLKRGGVDQGELAELNQLIYSDVSAHVKMAQSIGRGMGKQMRLQDEAERMAKALPMLLKLVSKNREVLKRNLMSFDFSGMHALRQDLEQAHLKQDAQVPSAGSIAFLRSPAGAAFVGEFIKSVEPRLEEDADCLKQLKSAGRKPEKLLPALAEALRALKQGQANGNVDTPAFELESEFNALASRNAHLFMVTSDREFWTKEAIDKVGTRFDTAADEPTRIFKQMHMRAAALGMHDKEVRSYMIQHISGVLSNSNMIIEGTKIGATAGAVVGNLMSTPVSAALVKYMPALAFPGVADIALMPAGWALGLAPGAAAGKWLSEMKKDRLAEAAPHKAPVKVPPVADSAGGGDMEQHVAKAATYASRSHSVKLGRYELRKNSIQKPALSPVPLSGPGQFREAHGGLWSGMAKEATRVGWGSLKSMVKHAPRDVWSDLVVHHGPNRESRGTFESAGKSRPVQA